MTDLLQQLDTLVALRAAATPGPWVNTGADNSQEGYFIEEAEGEAIAEVYGNTTNALGDEYGEHDADFIALAGSLDFAAWRAALPASPAPAAALAAGGAQPWGDEPWPDYLKRQQEKAGALAAERDAAVLYGKACDQRRNELREAAMRELPSYDEMVAAANLINPRP